MFTVLGHLKLLPKADLQSGVAEFKQLARCRQQTNGGKIHGGTAKMRGACQSDGCG